MISYFEDKLLCCGPSNAVFRRTLFYYLDGHSLRSLRSVSRVLLDLVGHQPYRLFHTIYLDVPLDPHRDLDSLCDVSPFCSFLVIRIGFSHTNRNDCPPAKGKRENESYGGSSTRRRTKIDLSSSYHCRPFPSHLKPISDTVPDISSARLNPPVPGSQQDWATVFSLFRRIQHLTLRVAGDVGWIGRTPIESDLVRLRSALESAELPALTSLALSPIHAMGILHLRWSGFGAFASTGSLLGTTNQLWRQITTLDMRVRNPLGAITAPSSGGGVPLLSPAQARMFVQVLHEYLRSFAPRLRRLRFEWIGGPRGPSPLTLDCCEATRGTLRPIFWPNLEELWLDANVAGLHRTLQAVRERAPRVAVVRTLRSASLPNSPPEEHCDSSVDILVREEAQCEHLAQSGGVYSHPAVGGGEREDVGDTVSRTSRVVPFLLDLRNGS